jgi:hypothetical protein
MSDRQSRDAKAGGGRSDGKGGGGAGGSRGVFDENTPATQELGLPDTVVVHPLVLLSVVDHFYRMGYKDAKDKRVIGVILGQIERGRVDVVNSYALPFEEDPKDPSVFYLDHDYLESLYSMFRKVRVLWCFCIST